MHKKLFSELDLSPDMLKGIHKLGFEQASPIQSQAIPVLLQGQDVIGQSQTGSGKTLAFAIPAIERVDSSQTFPQVLILCPTRELVVQVAEEVAKLLSFKRGIRELPIYGGQSYERQFRGLTSGAQIIIGTPGRILDHLERGSLKLEGIRMVILDESDRMLDMGFLEDIRTILDRTPEKKQIALFSATLPQPILKLVHAFTKDAVQIRIEPESLVVPAIEQVYYEVDRRSKLDVLCRLIDVHDVKLGIIFCATKVMVDELTDHLKARGYSADKLHGDLSQQMRERVMAKFRKHTFEFLVATDIAARGLDVEAVDIVFNYDLPQDSEDYIHRIGRTGRAGRAGKAIALVAGREIYRFQNIIRLAKGRIRRERVPSLEEVEEKRINLFFETLRGTLESGKYKRQDSVIERLLDQGYTPTDIASALIHLLNPSETRSQLNVENTLTSEKIGAIKPAKNFADSRPPPPSEMTRLSLNLGREDRIRPAQIVRLILDTTSLDHKNIGDIRLLRKTSLIDIETRYISTVLKKLSGLNFNGRKISLKKVED